MTDCRDHGADCPNVATLAAARLAAIRSAIEAEDVSYGELAELQSLAAYIDPTDVVLREWAGIPEHPED